MERTELLNQITEIFVETLDDEELVLQETTTANDVEDWDSLTHIMLVVAVEKKFKVKFTSKEILSWQNIGEMMDCILTK